jgi:hypothetical protein
VESPFTSSNLEVTGVEAGAFLSAGFNWASSREFIIEKGLKFKNLGGYLKI